MARWNLAALFISLAGLAGCATLAPPEAAATPPEAARSWAEVLRDHVDDGGRIDFAAIASDPAPLGNVVADIAQAAPANAPDRFPTRADQIAFYINSYNALAMYGVVQTGLPRRFGLVARARFFVLTKFVVGGMPASLYAYENDVIRPLGEERIHFALNCMAVSCPVLPRVPFTAAGLDGELDRAARHFFAEPRNVTVDDAARTVFLSSILKFYPDDFLKKAPSLIAYVNRYRTPPVPEDYRVRYFDYDWTINRQPAATRP